MQAMQHPYGIIHRQAADAHIHPNTSAITVAASPPQQGFPWLKVLGFLAVGGLLAYAGARVLGPVMGSIAARNGTPKPKKKKPLSWNYRLLQGRKTVYHGETKRPDERPGEHARDGKRFDTVRYDAHPVNRSTALAIQALRLAQYRATHGGRNPLYNLTNHG